MTTIDPHVAGAGVDAGHATAADVAHVAAEPVTGGRLAAVADWITTADHKKVGRLFMGTSLLLGVGVAVVGLLLGVERIDPTDDLLDSGAIPQLFSLFRLVLTFGVVVPLGLGLAIAVVPLQLGARALAFPRLAAAGFWAWLFGIGLTIGSIAANGGPGGGDEDMVQLFLVSMTLAVVGLVAAAGSLVVSVLTTRAPGMNMRRVPLFSWSALVYGLGLVLALPMLVAVLVALYLDHAYARTTFGGNVGIAEWLSVSVSQPATILYAVPVFGLLLETIATGTRARLPMRGAALIGIGLVGTAVLAGIAQVDANLSRDIVDLTFGDGAREVVPFLVLNALPLLGGAIVMAVMLLALAGRPRVHSPMVFAFFGSGMVLVGMLGNVLYRIGDAQLLGTVFEEAAWIYICYGTVLALLGGVVYWGPKLWGRTIPDKQVLPLALLGVLATILASLPYFIAGFADQVGGSTQYPEYGGPSELWNTLVAVGHGLMALTVVAFVGLALRSFTRGEIAGDDPWDGQTLEWATSSPAPGDNFSDIHVISSAEPLLDLKPARTESAA
jgi:heme/copper-type cytochrome/quinol oxidase subunit 1